MRAIKSVLQCKHVYDEDIDKRIVHSNASSYSNFLFVKGAWFIRQTHFRFFLGFICKLYDCTLQL